MRFSYHGTGLFGESLYINIYIYIYNSARYRCQARRTPGGGLMYPFEGKEEEAKSVFFLFFFQFLRCNEDRPLWVETSSARREWGVLGLPIYQKHVSKNRHSTGIGSKPFQ